MRQAALTLMAEAIVKQMRGTAAGHCARVDYFERQRAIDLCHVIVRVAEGYPGAFCVLAPSAQESTDPYYMSIDRAIELRNRKAQSLCLFIPSDMVDAAFSSLSNAFAPIDGGQIQREAMKQIFESLTPEGQTMVRAVRRAMKKPLFLSLDNELAFCARIAERDRDHQLGRVGIDLWQVGLIADSGEDWIDRLDRNRKAAIRLSLPTKIHSSTVERVDSLGVDSTTRTKLIKFLQQHQPVNDITNWSKPLSDYPDITLDCWVFPREDPSDLISVTILPFVNAQGKVEKQSNLKQPDGPNGILYASQGPKESITVRWKSDPPKPMQLHRWRVALVPSNEYIPDEDQEVDLPMREVSASRRSLKLSLDIDLMPDDLPEYPLCVRITPIDKSGNELRSRAGEDGQEDDKIIAHSQEFYLSNEPTPPKPIKRTNSLRTTPTIAFGRIEALLDAKSGHRLDEREPQWNATNTNFSLRVTEQRLINLASSSFLADIERRACARPLEMYRYSVAIDQVRPITGNDVTDHPLNVVSGDLANKWLSARKNFLDAVVAQEQRDLVAVADWKLLAEPARRYGDAYQRLLKELIEQKAAPDTIRELLCIDTLHIRTQGSSGIEEALVVLPTHPVRATWMASYTQLLHYWENRLSQMPPKERKARIDIEILRALEPTNIPPFLSHPERNETLLSAGNLGFFYGVYLPAPFVDSERRIADLAFMLGIEEVRSLITSDVRARQLAKHITTFLDLHPYVETLTISLVQTHNSPWISEALMNSVQPSDSGADESGDTNLSPALAMTAYVAHPETVTGIIGIDQLHQVLSEHSFRRESDHLHPAIASTITSLDKIRRNEADEAHLAIVGDLILPSIVPMEAPSVASVHSLSVYGLVVRLISSFAPHTGELRWKTAMVLPETIQHEHPAGPRYSNTLLELYREMQRAGGYIIKHDPDLHPAVMYTLEPHQEEMIHQIHTGAHWVITSDRFFALDYYDSPYEPTLRQQSQKYLIDYAPAFADGIGRRMFVTTCWRDEVAILIATVLRELGFEQSDQRVEQLLQYFKIASGQIALQLTQSDTRVAAAVGMGIVIASMKQRRELENAILIPIDGAPGLFSHTLMDDRKKEERWCDLMLLAIKRNVIDATFIAVKWRRGTMSLDSLATEMAVQMRCTAAGIRSRYFAIERGSKEPVDDRVDGVLQRAHFANTVRFYAERAHRYALLTDEAYTSLIENLRGIERPGYEFRPKYRGFIITREKIKTTRIPSVDEAVIDVITASEVLASAANVSSPRRATAERRDPIANMEPSALVNDTLPMISYAFDTTVQGSAGDNLAPGSLSEMNTSKIAMPTPPIQSHMLPLEIVITLGETSRGPVDWKPSVRGSPHLFIIGIPGQGKSVTTNHILIEMARQHIPALVLDFHGQFSESTGAFMRASGSQRIDAAEGLPFSPFEVMVQNGKADWKQNSAALADIFAYVVGLGGIQKDLLLNAIQDAYKTCGYAAELTEGQSLPTVEQVLKNIEQREHKQKVRNVAARCRPMLEMDLFKPTTGGSDLLTQIRQGIVIDLHDLMSETLQLAAGAFVLRKLYRDMFTWGQASSLRLAIVLDEAHRLAKDVTLPKLMKEGRKYGISVVVASQGLSDFHSDILGNAGTKIIFRTNYPESKKIAPYIQSRNAQDIAAQIEQLTVGTAFVHTSEMQHGLIVHMRSAEQ